MLTTDELMSEAIDQLSRLGTRGKVESRADGLAAAEEPKVRS
jgi:hypothetical protein